MVDVAMEPPRTGSSAEPSPSRRPLLAWTLLGLGACAAALFFMDGASIRAVVDDPGPCWGLDDDDDLPLGPGGCDDLGGDGGVPASRIVPVVRDNVTALRWMSWSRSSPPCSPLQALSPDVLKSCSFARELPLDLALRSFPCLRPESDNVSNLHDGVLHICGLDDPNVVEAEFGVLTRAVPDSMGEVWVNVANSTQPAKALWRRPVRTTLFGFPQSYIRFEGMVQTQQVSVRLGWSGPDFGAVRGLPLLKSLGWRHALAARSDLALQQRLAAPNAPSLVCVCVCVCACVTRLTAAGGHCSSSPVSAHAVPPEGVWVVPGARRV
jgi:hypothetical protein